MKKLIIFGTTVFSTMVARYIEMEKVAEIAAFCIDGAFIKEKTILNKPIVAFEEVSELYPADEYEFLNTAGYTRMNTFRQEVTQRCLEKGYNLFNYISTKAEVYAQVDGYNNIILPNSFVGFDVCMGNSNVIYSGCMLTHNITMGDNNFLAANSTFGGNVQIGNNCFVGLNATVKNSVKIGNKSLIGAGAYVSNNVKDGEVVVPARSVVLDKKSDYFI